jgi:diguanylate cyclase (GGDEF)-like protein/PAS domain S-box-containing protein
MIDKVKNETRAIDSLIKLKRVEEKFNMLFEFSPVGMALVNHATGDFIEVNRSLLKSTGYTKEEFFDLTYWDITPREYEQQEMQQIKDLNEKGSFGPNEKEYIRKDGSRYPIRIQGFIMTDVDGEEIVWGIIEDISALKRMEAQLRLEAMNDYLTGIYNRRFFVVMMKNAIANAERANQELAIIMFDVDNFKNINDEYGHSKGDEALVKISNIVKNSIRESDIFCRWGGDEFIIMLLGSNLDNSYKVAEKIKLRISEADYESPFIVTCSFGVAVRCDGQTDNDLIKSADIALYESKKAGRNCIRICRE